MQIYIRSEFSIRAVNDIRTDFGDSFVGQDMISVQGLSVSFVEKAANVGAQSFFPGYAMDDVKVEPDSGLTVLDVRDAEARKAKAFANPLPEDHFYLKAKRGGLRIAYA
ncbi:MAG: hypothetical protein DI551_09595 [Micavibrio aeruginosavorus]|uniref:Uncharacterized protein n=1 Tax=Micavibrio aeruginosavorus TaxID=349221 RepID=A0A2W5PQE1_9BACT|nr:MAG: hypothetical protein DI551_09595 [Micavibrio aeruginosavorus]